jgi:hypothetical protein
MSESSAVLQAKYVSVISPRSVYRSRQLVCLAGLCLVLAACDGGNSTGPADSEHPAEAASESEPFAGNTTDGGDNIATESQRSPGDKVEYDKDALPTTPLNVAALNFSQKKVDSPTIQAIVDTCAVLPPSTVDAIVVAAASRHSFGQNPTFTATTRGAACDYGSDTHLITLLVGSTDEVPGDSPTDNSAFVPPGAGEITATAWDEDSAIQILTEDSFGLNTAYAAMTVVGDIGLRVDNTGGTGIDYSSTGELFAELASAAAANVRAAPPPKSGDGPRADTPIVGNPCSIWTAAELEDFLLGTPFGNPSNSGGPNSCGWDGWDRNGASLSLQVLNPVDTYSIDILEPIGSSQGAYTFQGGGLPIVVVIDDIPRATLRIDMLDGSIPDEAVVALADNLVSRLTAR